MKRKLHKIYTCLLLKPGRDLYFKMSMVFYQVFFIAIFLGYTIEWVWNNNGVGFGTGFACSINMIQILFLEGYE